MGPSWPARVRSHIPVVLMSTALAVMVFASMSRLEARRLVAQHASTPPPQQLQRVPPGQPMLAGALAAEVSGLCARTQACELAVAPLLPVDAQCDWTWTATVSKVHHNSAASAACGDMLWFINGKAAL